MKIILFYITCVNMLCIYQFIKLRIGIVGIKKMSIRRLDSKMLGILLMNIDEELILLNQWKILCKVDVRFLYKHFYFVFLIVQSSN